MNQESYNTEERRPIFLATPFDHATYFAANDLPVFPLKRRGKTPATAHGFKDATCDPARVADWWERSFENNVGIATGSGLVVIDIDVDEDKDEDGLATLAAWEREHGKLPETFSVVTGRGGLHLYFRTDRRITCSANAKLGIDVRGDGGYVVAAGSVHPNGRTYEMQDWLEDMPIAEADEGVYALIDHVRPGKAKTQGASQSQACRFVLPDIIPEGQRHQTLVSYGASLRARNYPVDAIGAMLSVANATHCHPSCPDDELDKIVAWVLRLESPTIPGATAPEPVPCVNDEVPVDAYGEAFLAREQVAAAPMGDGRSLDEPETVIADRVRETVSRCPGGAAATDCKGTSSRLTDEEVMGLVRKDFPTLRLFEGNLEGCKDVREAADALMHKLAFWTRLDRVQMERLFRTSALFGSDTSEVGPIVERACGKTRMVYDERLGRIPVNLLSKARIPSIPFWDAKGNVRYNLLAEVIRRDLFARTIDGAVTYWDGRWILEKRAIEHATFQFTDEITSKGRTEVAAHIQDNRERLLVTDSGRDYDGHVYVRMENGTYRVTADSVTEVEPDPSMLVVGEVRARLRDVGPNTADEFLDAISCGNAQVRSVLEELVGACMTPAHVVSKSIVLKGGTETGVPDASNGKSTFIKVLSAIIGSTYCTSVSPGMLGHRFQAATVVGKLAIVADDIGPNVLSRQNSSVFKQIVSGNTIHTDVKNRDGFDFTPLATCVMSLNGSLEVRDMDDGLRRRLLFVPLQAHFEEGRSGCYFDLANQLVRDPDAIDRLAWLGMQGLQRLVARHRYTTIDGTDEMIEEIAREGDPVEAWVYDQNITYLKDVYHKTPYDVYMSFSAWGQDTGWKDLPNGSVFSRKLRRSRALRRTIEEAIRAERIKAPNPWKLDTSVCWSPKDGKTIRRYDLCPAG